MRAELRHSPCGTRWRSTAIAREKRATRALRHNFCQTSSLWELRRATWTRPLMMDTRAMKEKRGHGRILEFDVGLERALTTGASVRLGALHRTGVALAPSRVQRDEQRRSNTCRRISGFLAARAASLQPRERNNTMQCAPALRPLAQDRRISSSPSSSSLISNSLATKSKTSPPSIASSNPEIVNGIL